MTALSSPDSSVIERPGRVRWSHAGWALALLAVAAAPAAATGWTRLGPPAGAEVRALALEPGPGVSLWAGTDAGVTRWRPGGGWKSSPAVAGRVAGLAADPDARDTLYAATDSGLYLSRDDDRGWRRVLAFPGYDAFAVATAPGRVYAGTRLGLAVSADGGHSWSLACGHAVGVLAVAPGTRPMVYAGIGGLLSRWRDGRCEELTAELPGFLEALAVDPANAEVVYAATRRGLLRSRDGGRTWQFLERGLGRTRVSALVADPGRSGALWAATARGLHRSLDGGDTWRRLAPVPGRRGETASIDALLLDPRHSRRLAAATADGVFVLELATVLELHGGRFRVEAEWRGADGTRAAAEAVAGKERSRGRDVGVLWFLAPENWELLVKVLDGRAMNGHFWVYAAAATDLEVALAVTDTSCGEIAVYTNPLGRPAPAVTDVLAFPACAAPAPPRCRPDHDTLCLGENGRFRVEAAWRDAAGRLGSGRPALRPQSDLAGVFSFLAEDNWEVLVKVLDGCATNGRYWVYAAAATDLETRLTVTDRTSGETRTYHAPPGGTPALLDADAFPCAIRELRHPGP